MREGTGFRGAVLRAILAGIFLLPVFGWSAVQAEGGMDRTAGRGETLFRARIGESRGAAMAEAEKSVLLEAVRPMVHPLVFDKEKVFLAKTLMERREEILEGKRIVSDEGSGSGGREVVMAAYVREDLVEEAILGKLPRRVIIFTGPADGTASKGYVVDNAFSSAARKRGYNKVDLTKLNDERSKSLVASFRSGDRTAARPLCLYLLAKFIMEGSASARFSERTGDIYSSRADGAVKLTGAKGEPSSFAANEIKGFGSNDSSANLDALKKASALLASKAAKSLSFKEQKR